MCPRMSDDRVLPQFFPSLFHLANVKVVFPQFLTFLIEDWTADETIDRESLLRSQKDRNYALMQNFPKHLRRKIYEPFIGMKQEIARWRFRLSTILKLEYLECLRVIQWRSDGTIDAVRTAQQLVLDESIDIGKRFEVACMYCLETSVRALWTEMEESGQTVGFVAVDNSTANFWIRWMQEGLQVPWKQGISESLDPHRPSNIRYSCFFPTLEPKNREKFLPSLLGASKNDLHLCLQAMNKEEEEKMLALNACKVFGLRLEWPIHNVFLEAVEKNWNLIDFAIFRSLLYTFLRKTKGWQSFLYHELFLDFWRRSPDHLKEEMKEDADLKKEIDSFFDSIREERRKADEKEIRKKLKQKQIRKKRTLLQVE